MPIDTTSIPMPPASHASAGISDAGLLRGALGLALAAVIGLGIVYPLLGVWLGQTLFPHQANGSLIERDDQIVGSTLVAQPFSSPRYFQPRPSAAAYEPMAMSGSNQARSNPELRQRLDAAAHAIAERDGIAPAAVPGELLTQSGSGIDPHISPQAAAIQVSRIASVRGLAPEALQSLLAQHTERKQLGILGQERINVLELNLALDTLPTTRPIAP